MQTLISFRRERSITQTQFAELIGITQAALSRLEAGKIRPTLETAFAIERATNGAVPAASWVSLPEEGPAAEAVTVHSVSPTEDAA